MRPGDISYTCIYICMYKFYDPNHDRRSWAGVYPRTNLLLNGFDHKFEFGLLGYGLWIKYDFCLGARS